MKDDAEDIQDGFGRANGMTEPERKKIRGISMAVKETFVLKLVLSS